MTYSIPLPQQYRIQIGIDPGTHTGIAVWDRVDRRFLSIKSVKIHEAIFQIIQLKKEFPENIYVVFEDARLRKWFGDNGSVKQQGAGSIKRDCSILEDFLIDYNIPFEKRAPGRGQTKWSSAYFQKATKWAAQTSSHSRDAAVLVFER